MRRRARLRRPALLALALALSTGSALAADEGPTVRRIEWQGNEAFPKRELEGVILTTRESWRPWVEDRPFDEPTLLQDLERIIDYYRDRGYYEALASHQLVWDEDRSRVVVRIDVQEGEPVRLAELVIELPEHVPLEPESRAALLQDLVLREGEIFGVTAYAEAKQQLLGRLANLGFPAATLEGGAEVELETRRARVRWRVDIGPRVRFGPLAVIGLAEIEEELVRREVTFSEGEVFSIDALETTRAKLYDTDLFRSVALRALPPEQPPEATPVAGAPPEPGPPREEVWRVEATVEERPLRSLRAGVGFGTEDGPRIRVGWDHRNYFGQARTLGVSARYSSLVYGLDASLTQPRFFDPELALELRASARRETTPAYDADRYLTGVTFRRPLWPGWTGRVGHTFEWIREAELIADEDELPVELPSSSRLSSFELGLRRSTVDDPLNPRRGTWLDLSLEPSLEAIGSQLDYLRAVVEGRAYLPVHSTVLAARLRLGTLEPLGGAQDEDVPTVKRFYSGGGASVRGFDYQRLGPLDANDDPLGGLTLAEASLELRFPVWRQLGGVVFTDAGQVALEPSRLRGGDFFYATGAGIRYRTPIGPLRLDFGYVLNPPSGIDRFRIHLSVGQAF